MISDMRLLDKGLSTPKGVRTLRLRGCAETGISDGSSNPRYLNVTEAEM